MAGYYSGKDGELFIAGSSTAAAKVQAWTYSSSMSVIETTNLGDTDRTLVDGLRSYSGSCRLSYYTEAAGGNSNVNALLTSAQKVGGSAGDGTNARSTKVTLKFRLSEGTGDTHARDIVFSAWITGVTISSTPGEITSADITWEADGAPTTLSLV